MLFQAKKDGKSQDQIAVQGSSFPKNKTKKPDTTQPLIGKASEKARLDV